MYPDDTSSLCVIDECSEPQKYKIKKLCNTHNAQITRYGEIFPLTLDCSVCDVNFERGRAKKFCTTKCMKRFHQIKNHGLTVESVKKTLLDQNFTCQLSACKNSINIFSAHIDHNHGHCSGAFGCKECVRGLLCQHCNHMLGCARDNVDVLRSAVNYLEEFNERNK